MNDFTKIDSFEARGDTIFDLKHVSLSQIDSFSYKKIMLWNLETNKCLRRFFGHEHQVTCLEISSDKSKLYSGSADMSLRVWVILSGVCLETINLVSPISCLKLLSSDFIVVGLSKNKENLKIINLISKETVKSLQTQSDEIMS